MTLEMILVVGVRMIPKRGAAGARLMEFGESGLCFELRVWSTSLIHRRGLLTSSLNFDIYRVFTEHGIEIPYPRRDIHILRPPAAAKE